MNRPEGRKLGMQGKVLALKPYVEQIQALCQSLSREELVDLLVRLGVDSPVADRKRFLDQIEAALPGRRSRRTSRTKKEMKNLLDEVQGLRKSMEERRESIEDGTFWDDEDSWEWDSYDETPDLVGEDQAAVLESLFSSAGEFLLGGEFHGARELYSALFELILDLDEDVLLKPFSSRIEVRPSSTTAFNILHAHPTDHTHVVSGIGFVTPVDDIGIADGIG